MGQSGGQDLRKLLFQLFPQNRRRFPHVGRDEEFFVVLQVDHEAGGNEALVREHKPPYALPRGPGVDDVRGFPVLEQRGIGQHIRKSSRGESRVWNRGQAVPAVGHRDDAIVTGINQSVGKARDMIEAVGGEVAVVGEENVHASRGPEAADRLRKLNRI